MKWFENHIEIKPPKRTKKMTGTRFASVLGLNVWSTPFEMWCEITKTYSKPFEDTIYTIAGKTIEPKQAEFMKKSYFMDNLLTPTDVFGENYFQKTYGDFFKDKPIFGGMWDYILTYDDGTPKTVLEMKTTKRSEDWKDDVPEYYALQAALYAYLLDVNEVIMVCSFLEDKDYEHPENYVPTVENTVVIPFKLNERYPNFEDYIKAATDWWNEYVVTGISPDWDGKRDAETLKALRTANINPETDIAELIKEGEEIIRKIEELDKQIEKERNPLEKRLKNIKEQVKAKTIEMITDDQDKVTLHGTSHDWNLTKTTSMKVDEDLMKADGIYEKYVAPATSYKFSTSLIKEKK